MNKDGNSLATDGGYWQNTHLLQSLETQPTLELCVNPLQKSRNKGDTRRCLIRAFGAALLIPAKCCWPDPNPSHVPGMWICPFWNRRMWAARWHSFCRASSSPPEVHSHSGRPGGTQENLVEFSPNLSKASSKCLHIRLFRKNRHYGEIRNWMADTNEEQK